MSRLEDLRTNASVKGILPDCLVTVVSVQWFGSEALELTYKDPVGKVANELLYRDDESRIEIAQRGRPWSFDGDGHLFRLVSEAHRIRLAHLFDPVLAVHTSIVDPLPHQITAVYGEMLPRQPLRFLLADDPGSGKTIMAGLFIKELIARGDLQRCLVVCPGSLAEQWQDELYRRFHLPFEILTNDKLEAARTGNWFLESNLVIARLDKLSRDEDVQAKLNAPECRWDLVVCDEAHKMSASYFGGEIKYTKRYKLGQRLSALTRHFLLMTATPHNGKDADFQLFMALLDGDRFEGRFRDGVHTADVSDLMRRMVKEQLLKFDATPLFPERRAYTVPYRLSNAEAKLYKEVTEYVREEFNRAEALQNDKRSGTVGFALTILQRRLASSPEAIYQSLRRRKERLESRLRELEILQRGASITLEIDAGGPALDQEDLEDLHDGTVEEVEAAEEQILDQATAARTITELKAEIEILRHLESLALIVRRSGEDKKWTELAHLLAEVFTPAALAGHIGEEPAAYGSSPKQKLVIFTEHRDTLNYLEHRITTLLGRKEAVVCIHGGMGRQERTKAQGAFLHDPDVSILVATDAAGEGINLQRAHLMVNYDLPWNPNRIEQRFGRIHRIGQTEVCHLWNLVADDTREGEVYRALLDKLEEARKALGGQVFDVLGKIQFEGRPLRELLMEAVRYGERPEVRSRLTQVVADAFDRSRIQDLLEERALARDVMDASRVHRIREDMERAEARRLQPHYIESFFFEAFKLLGGNARQRETRRYELTHVPAPIRNRDRLIGTGEPVLQRYERIVFEKELINPQGQPLAAFICPGHPLLDATLDIVIERHRDLLRRGTVLIDERGMGDQPRILLYLEHAIQDASITRSGNRRVISKRMLYVEMDSTGAMRHLHYAPYLDYRPLRSGEPDIAVILSRPECAWISRDLEQQALSYAIARVVPDHLDEVKARKLELIGKTEAAVKDRLTKEISYWDHRAEDLKHQEQAGRPNLPAPRPGTFFVYVLECEGGSHYIGQTDNLERRWSEHLRGEASEWTKKHRPKAVAHIEEYETWNQAVERERELKTGFGRKWLKELFRKGQGNRFELPASRQAGARLNSNEARKRADVLEARLQKRMEELRLEAQLSPLPPVILGGMLVIPQGLLDKMSRAEVILPSRTAQVDTQAVAARARQIVLDIERGLGFEPTDRESEKVGYDIESRIPGTGKLRFIEVKGRITGAATITVTRNEILYSLNKPDDFILAIVEFESDTHRIHYVRRPFQREPDFGAASVNYSFAELLGKAGPPS